jgi:hypothetical protein
MMTERDDFEILPESRRPGRPPLGTGTWIILLVSSTLVAFSLGLAVGTMSSRFGRDAAVTLPTPAATVANEAPLIPVETPTPDLLTPTTMVTPTLTATLTPSPTPTAACTIPVADEFGEGYDQALLGCATAGAAIQWSAWEWFERGAMFWRSDTDQAYAFFNDGAWLPVQQGWDGQDIPWRGDPPPGLQAPIRGFGFAWATRDELFTRLGWATNVEQGFCALIQPFERGFLLMSSTVEFCRDTLYNTAREPSWRPLRFAVLTDGRWLNLPPN